MIYNRDKKHFAIILTPTLIMENEIYIDICRTNDAQIFTQVRLTCFMKYKEEQMLKVVYFQLWFDVKRHKGIEISVPVIDQLIKHTHMHRVILQDEKRSKNPKYNIKLLSVSKNTTPCLPIHKYNISFLQLE